MFIGQDVWANCSNEFEKVNLNCIAKYRSKMKKFAKKVDKSMVDDTYFYQTENGVLGKFKILSVVKTKAECIVYIDAVSYQKTGSYNPTSSLSISKDFNTWNQDIESFELLGRSSDLKLYNLKGSCVLQSENAKIAKYKKLEKSHLKEGKEMIFYAAMFLIGLAVFLVARNIFAEEEKFAASAKLEDTDVEENEKKKQVQNDIVLKYSRPFFKRYFTPIVQNMKSKRKIREKYKRKLASAGLNKEISGEDFFAFKLFLIIGAPILFLILRTFLEETWPLSLVPVISVIGFFYPDIWINGKIERRRKEITFGMPFVVDMLALSVEAGLDFMAAMARVMEKAPPSALVEEFETVVKDTKVGASRAESLRQLSWRVDTMEMSSFCATLIAADSVGANIGPILKTLAAEMRQKKSAEIEKQGAQAASKLIIPAIMFIIPAVFIIIMSPILFQMMAG
jgi:tight adherence protein C